MATPQTAAQYQSQIEQMVSNTPDFRQEVVEMYDKPVLQPLIQERQGLEGQYLNTLFEPFTQMGTSASDMSPAAKLNLIGGSMGRLQSRINANNAIQNFYGGQIDNLANQRQQQFDRRLSTLQNLFGVTSQAEEAARARAAQQRQFNAQLAQMQQAAQPRTAEQLRIRVPSENQQRAATAVNNMLTGFGGSARRGSITPLSTLRAGGSFAANRIRSNPLDSALAVGRSMPLISNASSVASGAKGLLGRLF